MPRHKEDAIIIEDDSTQCSDFEFCDPGMRKYERCPVIGACPFRAMLDYDDEA